ncbi:MAG: hypothetical protein NTU88_13055 [Armatimonadetes bacterium]|nr:hypothetical protein [Armatimonadota bacterium]
MTGDLGQLAQVRLGLRLELDAVEKEAGELDEAGPEPVASRLLLLLDVAPVPENAQESVHGALVEIQLRPDLRQVEPFRLVG